MNNKSTKQLTIQVANKPNKQKANEIIKNLSKFIEQMYYA